MKTIKIKNKLAAAIFTGLIAFSMGASAYAQDFHQGYPTDSKAVQKLYDEIDLQRATQAYMWAFPAVSFQSMYEGSKVAGVNYGDMIIADDYANSNSLFLTANTTTIYAQSNFTLKDGPIVVEVPNARFVGMVDDFWQRSLTDIGLAGPDKGKGGKYFFVPPSYTGEIPGEGYIIIKATQNSHNFMIRGLVDNGDVAAAVTSMKKTKVYPYADRTNPKPNRFVSYRLQMQKSIRFRKSVLSIGSVCRTSSMITLLRSVTASSWHH